jgi:hypothetical protein
VLPEVPLEMLDTMSASEWTSDLALLPFQRLGPDQTVKWYSRPKAKTFHFLTHKQDLILLENSIGIAFKAAATGQQLLGGMNSKGKCIFTDEERMRLATELVRCRHCHMNHYRLVFKEECVEQSLGTKLNILHNQVSLPLQLASFYRVSHLDATLRTHTVQQCTLHSSIPCRNL